MNIPFFYVKNLANLLRCGDMSGYNSLLKMYTSLYAMDEEQQ